MNATQVVPIASAPASAPSILVAARAACRRIAPLWPLQRFVAVNPFVGLSEQTFVEACGIMRRIVPGGMQMPIEFYQQEIATGKILESDLEAALSRATEGGLSEEIAARLDAKTLIGMLGKLAKAPSRPIVLTMAEAVDQAHGTSWERSVVESISQFCAAYHDEGQSAWRLPWKNLPLFAAWRQAALLDLTPELLGLDGFRARAARLPDEVEPVIAGCLSALGVAEAQAEDYCHKALMSVRGWAGAVQFSVRENAMRDRADDSILGLLAIRLAYDAALRERYDAGTLRHLEIAGFADASAEDVLVPFVLQLAHEHACERQMLAKLRFPKTQSVPTGRAALQAVFCIDVRSEIFRRSLESLSPQIQTVGFAGFFGLPIEYVPMGQHHGNAQCPVLLTPKFRVREVLRGASPSEEFSALGQQRLRKRLTYSWNSFKTAAVSCFSFVETAGLAFGAKLARDAFAPGSNATAPNSKRGPEITNCTGSEGFGIAHSDRVELALSALKNMGLTKNFARLVLLCGHGSQTANNPYGSGLDCGACGGHAGDSNARVGAAILNDPSVREALANRDILIPTETWFVAALHVTTTDAVTFFDCDQVPSTHAHDLAQAKGWLAAAGNLTRRERAPLLGLDPADPGLDSAIQLRSLDWAQVRPEWGLAGNAAFVAAPRSRTQSANLQGRAFLHNYDWRTDPENSVLELIMCAPMVVANWINLQYYASTVNNAVFGSGNKALHNVVGTRGVFEGNGGDLQTGLPIQSLHDGTKWIHEPLRLHVFLEAPLDRIDAVLAKHPHVRELVANGWLLLFAIDEDNGFHRCRPGAPWQPLP